MRFGFVGPSYTAASTAVADEECINLIAESIGSQGSLVSSKSYGGANALSIKSYFSAPGVSVFSALPQGPTRGSNCNCNGRVFKVSGNTFYEINADGTFTARGLVANDGLPASLAFNGIQALIVAGGHAYCFTLATNVLLEVTAQLAGTPIQCDSGDTYFAVIFANSNKFQLSQVLDGTTWPGQLVNEVSVFPDNVVSLLMNHRELWLWGTKRCQPYQDTGSTEVYDVIPGAMIETGSGATFAVARSDNSTFWIGQDERGGRMAWRSNGYIPGRISTYAVETDLASYTAAQIAAIVSYSYQDRGHIYWVLYVPGSSWSWAYDIGEGLWAKRAKFINGAFQAHWGWNHVYAFGLHLVGDWNSGNVYVLASTNTTDAGGPIRRVRQSPTVGDEMQWLVHDELTIDFDTGQGPQPPLLDGGGNPRGPQCMLEWSDDRGKTWSNQLILDCGQAGKFRTRAVARRLGRSRYRVYRVSMTDAISWTIVDAYLKTHPLAA